MSDVARSDVANLVPRGTFDRLQLYADALTDEATRQNLVSAATLETLWERHILDSLQLIDLATTAGTWVDIGSGAGLPGMIVAIATEREVVLIEPRRRRAAFLAELVARLALDDRVRVLDCRCEVVTLPPPAIISARAVAATDRLFAMADHFAARTTQWILPKGRSAAEEVAAARRTWQGEYRLVPSLTEAGSSIVIASDIRRRGRA